MDFSRLKTKGSTSSQHSRGKEKRGKSLLTLDQGFCDPNKWPEFKPNIQKFRNKFQFLG